MKKSLISILLGISAAAIFSSSSCRKSCQAGSGGDVTLVLKPQHHTIPIAGSQNYRDTAYIKFNATDFPGPSPSLYDMVVAGNANEDFVRVSGLKCGQYYIMMTGFDTSAVWNIRVIGGLPVDFDDQSGEKTIVVPVNE